MTDDAPALLRRGDKIKFFAEKGRYRVRAASERFAICTKPFNPQRTVIYTVVDLVLQVRGTENLIFGMGAESDQDCDAMLARLVAGETSVSRRNYVALDLEEVVGG